MPSLTPFPAIVDRPLPDKFGAGMSWLARWTPDDRAEASWIHTMIGTLWGTDSYFRFPSTTAATDYGIGGIRDGASDGVIFRWINYYARRNTAGWASGWSDTPDLDGDGAALMKELGIRAVNGTGRSIELSGMVADVVTAKQWAATIHLTAAIHHHELEQGYEQFKWNMHHREVAEKDCPFPRVYAHTVAYQTGVNLIMEHYETGKDIPDTVRIAGLDVPLAGGLDADGVVTPPPEKPILVPFPKITVFTTRKGALSRQWGTTDAEIVRRYPTGTELRCMGYVHGDAVSGQDRWLVIRSPGISNNARIHESGVVETIVDPAVDRA